MPMPGAMITGGWCTRNPLRALSADQDRTTNNSERRCSIQAETVTAPAGV